jgi:hypothetical protein
VPCGASITHLHSKGVVLLRVDGFDLGSCLMSDD